ncbi:MAG: glycosyltransferase [Bacteroides sp.]|jgi:glycosyltransferase involved in cell wall biosynthesis|nr:glycosyltransferase [Bacteroides sp.]
MKLLIISHTPHYEQGEQIVGWGSTVREIDQLATLFDQIVHLAPLHPGPPPGSSLPYQAPNFQLHPVRSAGGNSLWEKLSILARIPLWLFAMKAEMQAADALHIRCPAGISLVGLLAARLWAKGKPTWVKYAGNWESYKGQASSYKFQRWFVNKNHHKGVVTINGKWKGQPEHVLTFHNPSFSEIELIKAREKSKDKNLAYPLQLLFVGRLSRAKGVHRVLQIVKRLHEIGVDFQLTLVGGGSERSEFESFVQLQGLDHKVMFTGWQPMSTLGKYYQTAHFLIFPSSSEGWPKVLSEAMAYGVVPLASTVSSIPQILEETGAGMAIHSDDIEAYIQAILQYTQNVTAWQGASQNGQKAATRFTYEHYLSDVWRMFHRFWQINLNHG